jgi:peptide/nickel transport system permease protein
VVGSYVARRVALMIPTLIGASVVVFVLVRLVPGTIVETMLGPDAHISPEVRAELLRTYGLDRPVGIQYLDWVSRVAVGDWGTSWRTGQPVFGIVLSRMGVTAQLTIMALVLASIFGLTAGTVSAFLHNKKTDRTIQVASLTGLSTPMFWQGTVLLVVLGVYFGWSPPRQWQPLWVDPVANLQKMILPALTLATVSAAVITRMMRSSLLEVLHQDHVRTARAKGLRERDVKLRHAVRNSLITSATVIGLQFGYLMGGLVVIEEVFTLPGLGRLILTSIYQRDYPILQGGVLAIGLVFMLTNLVVDLLYGRLDPRVRY